MSFRPIISQPSRKALLRGVLTMLLVYVAGMIMLNFVLSHSSVDADPDPNDIAAELIPLLVYLASGFVVGFNARRSPLMHGALLGFIIASIFLVPPLRPSLAIMFRRDVRCPNPSLNAAVLHAGAALAPAGRRLAPFR